LAASVLWIFPAAVRHQKNIHQDMPGKEGFPKLPESQKSAIPVVLRGKQLNSGVCPARSGSCQEAIKTGGFIMLNFLKWSASSLHQKNFADGCNVLKLDAYKMALLATCKNFNEVSSDLKRTEYYSTIELERLQLYKLKILIAKACLNVPAYSKRYNGIASNGIDSLGHMQQLPIITKKEIKQEAAQFMSNESIPFTTAKTTGGSTGEPVTIWKTREARAGELAAMWRGYGWAGISFGDKQARFWGVPLTKKGRMKSHLVDFICNRRRLSAFSFNPRSLEEYSATLEKFQPDFFYGYASMLCEFADYVDARPGKITLENLKAIISTSEVLHDEQRRKLEKVFGVKVFDEYGSGELGIIAQECEQGCLHIAAENLLVEILDGDRPVDAGQAGEIVVTELNNYAMPLIRYRLGDFASLRRDKCSCGRGLPVLEKVFGRAYDTIRISSGQKFHGEFFMYIFEEAKRKDLGIGKFQVIQKKIDHLQINIVPERKYSPATEKFLVSQIKEKLDRDITVSIEKVHDIPREKSGKVRLIVNGLPEA
jgi:phenylacetate-CoA ligase